MSLPVRASNNVNPLRDTITGIRPSSSRYSTCDCAMYANSAGPPTYATVGST